MDSASMALVNNINKGQLKSLIESNLAFSNGLKSFHHNHTNDLIDNQIHHILNTTQYEHDNITDTYTRRNKTPRPEDTNNNIDIDLIQETTDSDDSLSTEDIFHSYREEDIEMSVAKDKDMNNRIPKMQLIQKTDEPNKNVVVKSPSTATNTLDEMKNRVKTLRKRYPSDKSKAVSSKFRPSKRLLAKRENLQKELQHELLTVLAKKNKSTPPKTEDKSFSQLTREKEFADRKDSCQVCDQAPPSNGLLSYNEMPPHLQFNPYITSGYRPILDAWGCLRSLCYIHNETVNIFTHGKSLW